MTPPSGNPFPDSPGAMLQRMGELEVRLQQMDNEWGEAARDASLEKHRMEREKARLTLTFKGQGTVQEVASLVIDALWVEHEDLMNRYVIAEAAEEACKASFRAIERELSSLQTRLNALQRLETMPSQQGQDGRD